MARVVGTKIVCPDCRGEGVTMLDSMRFHGYVEEEVDRAFIEEMQAGVYDETCHTCKGLRVIDETDAPLYYARRAERLAAERRGHWEY
jgi:hypothetical protein